MKWALPMICALLLTTPSIVAAQTTAIGQRIADSAWWHLVNQPELDRDDCSGAVQQILERAGFARMQAISTEGFWLGSFGEQHQNAEPAVGDLVFFDGTANKDTDPRVTLSDKLTHIGIVLDLQLDGTATILHRSSTRGALSTVQMNLNRPNDATQNDVLSRSADLALADRRASKLFYGFVTLDPVWMGGPIRPVPNTASVLRNNYGEARQKQAAIAAAAQARNDPHRIILDGRRLQSSHVQDLSCSAMWGLRNTVYARHGYAFRTHAAQIYFDARAWYERNEDVTPDTVDLWLTDNDIENIELVVGVEIDRACRNR